jgi:hypothetical protein
MIAFGFSLSNVAESLLDENSLINICISAFSGVYNDGWNNYYRNQSKCPHKSRNEVEVSCNPVAELTEWVETSLAFVVLFLPFFLRITNIQFG